MALSFNGDIGDWDTSSVTTMSAMFDGAAAFNRDIGRWNVSRVTSMGDMFVRAALFIADLSHWNVGRVISMEVRHTYRVPELARLLWRCAFGGVSPWISPELFWSSLTPAEPCVENVHGCAAVQR